MREALKFRREGWAFHEIGELLGVGTAEAFGLVKAALNDAPAEDVADARKVALDRLDAEYARLERIHVELAPLTKSPRELDDGPDETAKCLAFDAVDRSVKITEAKLKVEAQRAKLLGLNAPTKIEATGKDGAPLVSADDILGRIDRIVAAATAGAGASGTGEESPEPDP